MRANELMIGDWVLDGGVKARVTSIMCDGIIETTKRISNEEIVEPIPLTQEILEKNGFEKIHLAYTVDKYHYLYAVSQRVFIKCLPFQNENLKVSNWFGVQIVNNELDAQTNLNSSCDVTCAYVHELQHALRLCGIKKEIKLRTDL